MKPVLIDWEPVVCSIDPISLTALAVAGIAGVAGGTALASSSAGGTPAPGATPSSPPPITAAAPAAAPATERPKPKSTTPSFIGGSAVPDSRSFGSKTLLGQ